MTTANDIKLRKRLNRFGFGFEASGDPLGRILAPEIPKPKSEKQVRLGTIATRVPDRRDWSRW